MKKKICFVILSLVFVLAGAFHVSAADDQVTVGFAAASTGWPWYATFIDMVEEISAENGWETIVLGADGDVTTQLNQLLDLIEKKVDYIILGPLDPQAAVPGIKKAYEAGIPVVIIGNDIAEENWDYVAAIRVVDDRQLGKNSAELMAEALEGKDSKKIFVVDGLAGQPAVLLRWEAMTPVFEEAGIEVVASEYADWDMIKAIAVTEDMVTRFPNIDGVFSIDGAMTPGVVQVLEESDMDVPVVGLGGTATEKKLIEDGKILGTSCQSPGQNAKDAMAAIASLIKGEEIPKWAAVETPKTTIENLDSCPGDW
jgi:ABC-type sugar transport system substrate-binding protein